MAWNNYFSVFDSLGFGAMLEILLVENEYDS